MTTPDELFDRQVHDAYESVQLSGEAEERILANLRAAQAEVSLEELADVVPMEPARRRRTWRVVLPLAAALLGVFVVVRVVGSVGAGSMQYAESADMAAYEMDGAAGGATEDEAVSEDAEELSTSAKSEALQDALSLAELYPQVTLADGTVLSALEDATEVREVDASEIGQKVADAQATPFDAADSVPCEVFELVGETDAFAVRYEGEDSYWYCALLS